MEVVWNDWGWRNVKRLLRGFWNGGWRWRGRYRLHILKCNVESMGRSLPAWHNFLRCTLFIVMGDGLVRSLQRSSEPLAVALILILMRTPCVKKSISYHPAATVEMWYNAQNSSDPWFGWKIFPFCTILSAIGRDNARILPHSSKPYITKINSGDKG